MSRASQKPGFDYSEKGAARDPFNPTYNFPGGELVAANDKLLYRRFAMSGSLTQNSRAKSKKKKLQAPESAPMVMSRMVTTTASNPGNISGTLAVRKAFSKQFAAGQHNLAIRSVAHLYACMLANPRAAQMVASPDEWNGTVALVKQSTVTNGTYRSDGVSPNNCYMGALFTGRLRDFLYLTNSPSTARHVFCMLTPDGQGNLSDNSSAENSSGGPNYRGVLFGPQIPVHILSGVSYPLPIRTAVAYSTSPGSNGSSSMITPSSIYQGGQYYENPSYGQLLPCLAADTLTFDITAACPAGTIITVGATFLNSGSGFISSPTTTITSLLVGQDYTQESVNLTIPAQAVAMCNFNISVNAAPVTLLRVEISLTPSSLFNVNYLLGGSNGVFNISMPFAQYTAVPSHDYSTLVTAATGYRMTAGSMRLTDGTAIDGRNGFIAAMSQDKNTGPGDCNCGSYSLLSMDPKAVQLSHETGFYGVLKPMNVFSKTMVPIARPWGWEGNYLQIAYQGTTSVTYPTTSRIVCDAVYELETDSQLFPQIQATSDILEYQAVLNAMDRDGLIGDNPSHLQRIGKFLKRVGNGALNAVKFMAPVLSTVPYGRGLVMGVAAGERAYKIAHKVGKK